MRHTYLIVAIALGISGFSGQAAEKTYDFPKIHGIDAGAAFNIIVDFGASQSVIIEEEEGRFENLDIKVNDGILDLGWNKNWHGNNGPNYTVKLTLTSLDQLELSGASRALINGIKAKDLLLDASGASQIVISGSCTTLRADASGATKLVAKDLECRTVALELSGAATASVFASEKLDADTSGASRLIVHGNPPDAHEGTSGAAKIEMVRN